LLEHLLMETAKPDMGPALRGHCHCLDVSRWRGDV